MFEKCNSEETKNNAINVLDKFYKWVENHFISII